MMNLSVVERLKVFEQFHREKFLQVFRFQERITIKRSLPGKMLSHQVNRLNGCCKLQECIQQILLFIKLLVVLTTCSYISNAHSVIHQNQSSHISISNLNQQAISNKISPTNFTLFRNDAIHDTDYFLGKTRATNDKLVDLYLKEQDFNRLFSLGFDELMRIIYLREGNEQVQEDLKNNSWKRHSFETIKSRKRRDLEEREVELLTESSTISSLGLSTGSRSAIDASLSKSDNRTTGAPWTVHVPDTSSVNTTHMQLVASESSVPANHQAIPREEVEDSSNVKSSSKSTGRSKNRSSKAAKKASRERESQLRQNEKVVDEFSTPVTTLDRTLHLNSNDAVIESPLEPLRYNDGIVLSNEQSNSISSTDSDYQGANSQFVAEPAQPIVSATPRGFKSSVKRKAPATNYDHPIRFSSATIPAPEQNPLRSNKAGYESSSTVDVISELDDNSGQELSSSQPSASSGESINESTILDHSGNNKLSGLSDEQVRDMIRLVENHGLLAKSMKKPNQQQQQHREEHSQLRGTSSIQASSLYNINPLSVPSDQVDDSKLTPVDNVSRLTAPYVALEPSVIPIAESNPHQQLVPALQQQLSRHNQLNQGRMTSSFSNQFEPSYTSNDNNYLQQQINAAVAAQKSANNYPSFSAPVQQSAWVSQVGGSSKDRGVSGGKLQVMSQSNTVKDLREVTKISPPTSAKLRASESRQHTNTAGPSSNSAQLDQFFNPRVIPLGNVRDESSSSTTHEQQQQNNFPSLHPQNQMLTLLRTPSSGIQNSQYPSSSQTTSFLGPQARLYPSPTLIRRTSPILMLSPGGQSATNNGYPTQLRAMKLLASPIAASTSDYLPLTAYSSLPFINAAAIKYNRAMQQQQPSSPTHRTMTAAYQNRVGRVELGNGGSNGGGYDETGAQASMSTASTSDPMWSNSQNHEEDYQQSPQTIQITAVPNGLGLANGFNGFNGLNGWNGINGINGFAGGWGGPWNGRQVLLVNKQPQVAGSEWRNWMIPVAIILALPLILGALFVPVFLKSVMFLIQILQMLGLLMPPSQLASHLLSNSHNQSSG